MQVIRGVHALFAFACAVFCSRRDDLHGRARTARVASSDSHYNYVTVWMHINGASVRTCISRTVISVIATCGH